MVWPRTRKLWYRWFSSLLLNRSSSSWSRWYLRSSRLLTSMALLLNRFRLLLIRRKLFRPFSMCSNHVFVLYATLIFTWYRLNGRVSLVIW